jgi:hypothetical protein
MTSHQSPAFYTSNTPAKDAVGSRLTFGRTDYSISSVSCPDAASARAAWDRGAVLAVQFDSEPA